MDGDHTWCKWIVRLEGLPRNIAQSLGWCLTRGLAVSPVLGAKGSCEYFYWRQIPKN